MSIRLTSKEQEELVLKNQRLVYHFVNKLNVAPSEYEDMVSIGTIGLIKAAATFDKDKKTKFSTYASRCINNELFMHLRKEKLHIKNISLDDLISKNDEGKEMTVGDKIPSSDKDFTEEILESENFIKIISIILNLLEPRERLIMLYGIAEANQSVIAEALNISQSYVSRLKIKLNKKVKAYLTTTKQFKEVFSMSIEGDSYKISFASKDIKHFNKIFATLLQKTSTEDLPDFKVNCNKERIVVQIPAHPESFSFIAKIIQEIDDFSMTFVSNKTTLPTDNTISQKIESNDTDESDNSVEETVSENPISKDNIPTSEEVDTVFKIATDSEVERGSKVKQVRDYMLSMDSFTVKELKQHFPNMTTMTINNAIQLAKTKGLITGIERGKYVVNKTWNTEGIAIKFNSNAFIN